MFGYEFAIPYLAAALDLATGQVRANRGASRGQVTAVRGTAMLSLTYAIFYK